MEKGRRAAVFRNRRSAELFKVTEGERRRMQRPSVEENHSVCLYTRYSHNRITILCCANSAVLAVQV